MMRAVVVKSPGDVNVMEIINRPIPKIKDGWTLVKVIGFGINRSEIFTRLGYSPTVKFPRVLGIECVGRIVDSKNSNFKKGQVIISIMGEMGRDFDGSYQEYVLLPDEQIYTINSKLSTDSLIALPETYYTAYGAFKNLQINENDRVLVRGATSGVGVAFSKIVKANFPQIRLCGTTRTLDKSKQLYEAGFDEVILDCDDTLQTDKSYSKILELIGPKTLTNSLFYLDAKGIICSCGQLGGQWYLEAFDPIEQLRKNVYLTTFYSGNVSQHQLQELIDFVENYSVDTSPQKVFTLEEIKKAHRYLENNGVFGKVIIKMEE